MTNSQNPHLILGRAILLKFLLELNGTQQQSITGDKNNETSKFLSCITYLA